MSARPLLLDLFCGAGGAAWGYHNAGFEVIGVDINPQPNYPFEFVQGDVIEVLTETPVARLADAIHTSPPCQASCTLIIKGNQKATASNHINLIPKVRQLLARSHVPTVIENVQGSDLRRDVTLCGETFGLGVIRHRYFEINNATVPQPPHLKHRGRVAGYRHGEWFDGPYFAVYGEGGGKGSVAQWQNAMGIHWTDVRKEIAEAIPPAYTEYIGSYIIEAALEAAS